MNSKLFGKEQKIIENLRKKLWSIDGKSHVSLLVGAGFSLNATKIDESLSSMMLWENLKNTMIDELDEIDANTDLDVLTIGQMYEDTFGKKDLESLLEKSIPDQNYKPNELYQKLLNLPFKDIFTTNYDTLLERAALENLKYNYQPIYTINDIPGSDSPRIVKLHGSFPSYRPLIFSKKSYQEYPKKFAPFVNMVQQSIMENTLVLIGFSGDDPNFEKWITWVTKNLGDYKPKIYLIGRELNIKNNAIKKNITTIDFKSEFDNFHDMFEILFDFLGEYPGERPEEWLEKKDINVSNKNIEDTIKQLKNVRESYPGWLIMPAKFIPYVNINTISSVFKLIEEAVDNNLKIELIYEIVWVLNNFRMPIIDRHLDIITNTVNENNLNETKILNIALYVVKEYRLRSNEYIFEGLIDSISKVTLSGDLKNEFEYQKLLMKIQKNGLIVAENDIKAWQVDTIGYRLKKLVLLTRVYLVDGQINIEDVKQEISQLLQTVRSIQIAERNNIKAISIEMICEKLISKISRNYTKSDNYKIDRINKLLCNPIESINLTSQFRNGNNQQTTNTKNFDNVETETLFMISYGYDNNVRNGYFLNSIFEELMLGIDYKNIRGVIPSLLNKYYMYGLKLLIEFGKDKSNEDLIEDVFSRSAINNMEQHDVYSLYNYLKNVIDNSNHANVIYFDIISRLYTVLDLQTQYEFEEYIISKYKNISRVFAHNYADIFDMIFERILEAKKGRSIAEFVGKIFNLPILNEPGSELENVLPNLNQKYDVMDKISKKYSGKVNFEEKRVYDLIGYLDEKNNLDLRYGALFRIIFLLESKNLENINIKVKKEIRKTFENNKNNDLKELFDNGYIITLLHSNKKDVEDYLDSILEKGLIKISVNGSIAINGEFSGTLNTVRNIIVQNDLNNELNTKLIEFVFSWWENQYPLLKNANTSIYNVDNFIRECVLFIKNTIFWTIKADDFSEQMKDRLEIIYYDLKKDHNPMYIWLIPGMMKIGVINKDGVQELVDSLQSAKKDVISYAINAIHDFAKFSLGNEESKSLSRELLSMFNYQNKEIINELIELFILILKDKYIFFDQEDLVTLNDKIDKFYRNVLIDDNQDLYIGYESIAIKRKYIELLLELSKIYGDVNTDKWKKYCAESNISEIKMYSSQF